MLLGTVRTQDVWLSIAKLKHAEAAFTTVMVDDERKGKMEINGIAIG